MLMVKQIWCPLLGIALGLAFSIPVSAQEPFYKGTTMRIVVGASAGGAVCNAGSLNLRSKRP